MPDDLFRGQSAQLETLLNKQAATYKNASFGSRSAPKDEANNNSDMFKDQSALLESLPHKKASAEDVSLPTPANNSQRNAPQPPSSQRLLPAIPVNYLSGMGNRLFVVAASFMILATITVTGGITFVEVEKADESSSYQPFPNCFKEAREKNSTNITEAIDSIQKCIKEKQKLSDLSMGSLFSWSLYATIGYGHRFPFTFYGQLICAFYAWLFIPLYMALKIEFGEILALIILMLGSKLKKLVIRFGPECITKSVRKQSYHPSDLVLVLLLLIILCIFMLPLSLLVMYTNKLSFWRGFYLTTHTVLQVGLGDITPTETWPTFVLVMPLVLVGDTLSSYLHYYIHGIYRLNMHRMAVCVTGCHVRDEEEVPQGQQLVMASNVGDFVTVTNHTMPLRATSAEVMRREKPTLSRMRTAENPTKSEKSERTKEKKKQKQKPEEEGLATPPESAKEDETQDGSQQRQQKKKMTAEVVRTPKQEASLIEKTAGSQLGGMEDLKTPKSSSWIGKVGANWRGGSQIKPKKGGGTKEMMTPLLQSVEPIEEHSKRGKKVTGLKQQKDIRRYQPSSKMKKPEVAKEDKSQLQQRSDVLGPLPDPPDQVEAKTSREPDKSWFG